MATRVDADDLSVCIRGLEIYATNASENVDPTRTIAAGPKAGSELAGGEELVWPSWIYRRHQDFASAPFRQFAHSLTGDRRWLASESMSWIDRRFQHCGLRFFILNSTFSQDALAPGRASFSMNALNSITRGVDHAQAKKRR